MDAQGGWSQLRETGLKFVRSRIEPHVMARDPEPPNYRVSQLWHV